MVSAAERRSNKILLGVLSCFVPNHQCYRLKKTSFSCIQKNSPSHSYQVVNFYQLTPKEGISTTDITSLKQL